jgi:hypothetical protein
MVLVFEWHILGWHILSLFKKNHLCSNLFLNFLVISICMPKTFPNCTDQDPFYLSLAFGSTQFIGIIIGKFRDSWLTGIT